MEHHAEQVLDLDALLRDAAAEAVAREDPDRFREWLRARLPWYWHDPTPPSPGLADALARALWNVMPLPGNHLRPRPVTPPGRNDPCPCGSGHKYKQCCRDADAAAPELPVEMLYAYVLDALGPAARDRLLADPRTPVGFALAAADAATDRGRPLNAARSLEPLFAEGAPLERHDLDVALSRLFDCYSDLGHDAKKDRLIARLIKEAPPGPVRAEAWARRAAIALDRGDREAAFEAFRMAQRDAPDDPSHGPREITMLLSTGALEQARERAGFWAQRLRRAGYGRDERPLSLVEAAAIDPEAAMVGFADDIGGYDATALREWAQAARERPAEGHAIERLEPDPDDAAGRPEGRLVAPAAVAAVEQAWDELLDRDDLGGLLHEYPEVWWAPEAQDRWREWLQARPGAGDSLAVLSDLVTATPYHPAVHRLPAVDDALARPLLERAHDLLAAATRGDPEATLPWHELDNRPALHCLATLAQLEQRTGHRERARSLLEWLLHLNPNDNHGLRAELMSLYLERGDDARAVALADAYPDDILAATRFGRVLALYRMDRKREAAAAARAVHAELPRVRDYLVRKRVRRPQIDPGSFAFGGADQAWLYREAARHLWERTPGALAWLQRTLPAGGQRRQRR